MFTFKTEKPAGRYRCFFKPTYQIKMKRKMVGMIDAKTFKIRLMIMKDTNHDDGNPNCPWMWITLTKENLSVDEAKQWLQTVENKILSKYSLYDQNATL